MYRFIDRYSFTYLISISISINVRYRFRYGSRDFKGMFVAILGIHEINQKLLRL